MTVADTLVSELMLVSVLVAGSGDVALADALEQAGAAAEVLGGEEAAAGYDLAILLAASDAATEPSTRTLVERLSRSSDRLLLAPTPLGRVAAGEGPALPELASWFELFAELGYQPVVEFDAGFVSAGAFLVDRAAIAAEGDLAAFSDRLQFGAEAAGAQREAVAEAERNVRAELSGVRGRLAAMESELATGRAALAACEERNAGWDGLRSWVQLEAARPERAALEVLARDLARLNAMRAPDLAPVVLPRAARWSWFRRPAPAAAWVDDAALVRGAQAFDAAWYVAANPEVFAAAALDPVWHYVLVGGPRGHDPGPWFDTAAYLVLHPEAKQCPLAHAVRSGAVPGR